MIPRGGYKKIQVVAESLLANESIFAKMVAEKFAEKIPCQIPADS